MWLTCTYTVLSQYNFVHLLPCQSRATLTHWRRFRFVLHIVPRGFKATESSHIHYLPDRDGLHNFTNIRLGTISARWGLLISYWFNHHSHMWINRCVANYIRVQCGCLNNWSGAFNTMHICVSRLGHIQIEIFVMLHCCGMQAQDQTSSWFSCTFRPLHRELLPLWPHQ